MGTERFGNAAAGALLVGVGAFAGSWGGARIAAQRAQHAPIAAVEPGDERDLRAELDGAAAELRAVAAELRGALARLGSSAPPARESERTALAPAGAFEDRDELASSVRSLAAAVEALRASSNRESAPRARVATSAERAASFGIEAFRAADAAADGDALDSATQRFLSEHILWTYDDVLATYGRPDRVEGGTNSMAWIYLTSPAGAPEERIQIHFNDGRVLWASYDRDD